MSCLHQSAFALRSAQGWWTSLHIGAVSKQDMNAGLWCHPRPNHCVTIHKKIRFHPCHTWNNFWIWRGKPERCIWEKRGFTLHGVGVWGAKRFVSSKEDASLRLGFSGGCFVFFLLEYVLPFQACTWRLWSRGTASRKEKTQHVCFWYKHLQLHWPEVEFHLGI